MIKRLRLSLLFFALILASCSDDVLSSSAPISEQPITSITSTEEITSKSSDDESSITSTTSTSINTETTSTSNSTSDTSTVPSDTSVSESSSEPSISQSSSEPSVSESSSQTNTSEPNISETTSEASTSEDVSEPSINDSSSSSEEQIEPTVYIVTFNTNGGSAINPVSLQEGEPLAQPSNPVKAGYKFINWTFDSVGNNVVSWPLVVTKDLTLYAHYNEQVPLKDYVSSLMSGYKLNPLHLVPEAMQAGYNTLSSDFAGYDFAEFVATNTINYGGHGEQWHMVLSNLNESMRFFNVLSGVEVALGASVVAFNNYIDSNPNHDNTITLKQGVYDVTIAFEAPILAYVLAFETTLLGVTFNAEIVMYYDITSGERTVRISLNEHNALTYKVLSNGYEFALKYGLNAENIRSAYFTINEVSPGHVEGALFEYITAVGKDLIKSAAQFVFRDGYASVVGNKASGMLLFTGYINELYHLNSGKLLGYEVREVLTGITYNTLWFNLNNVSNLTHIKLVENENKTGNPHDIYLNNSSDKMETTNFGGLGTKMLSRRYDIELRSQYFYNFDHEGKLVTHESNIPMLFVQQEKLSDFASDFVKKNSINATITLSQTIINKIISDYETYIDIFISNKDNVSREVIIAFIGENFIK